MSRITPPKSPGLFARIVYFMTRRTVGKVVTPVRVAANHRTVLRGYALMEQAQMGARRVDAALKSLVQVRVASLVGCPF